MLDKPEKRKKHEKLKKNENREVTTKRIPSLGNVLLALLELLPGDALAALLAAATAPGVGLIVKLDGGDGGPVGGGGGDEEEGQGRCGDREACHL